MGWVTEMGLWVAVGNNGAIVTSADGATWTPHGIGGSALLNAVAYGDGRFVAAANDEYFYVSQDGVTWTPVFSGLLDSLTGITYANGLFVAVSEGGSTLSSPDGLNWPERFRPGPPASWLVLPPEDRNSWPSVPMERSSIPSTGLHGRISRTRPRRISFL